MSTYLPYEANRVRMDDVLREAQARRAARSTPAATVPAMTIRRAGAAHHAELDRLAALDSARPLAGDILVAEVAGELQAALEIASGFAVADPFRPTADLVRQLRTEAKRLVARPVQRRRRRLVPRFAL